MRRARACRRAGHGRAVEAVPRVRAPPRYARRRGVRLPRPANPSGAIRSLLQAQARAILTSSGLRTGASNGQTRRRKTAACSPALIVARVSLSLPEREVCVFRREGLAGRVAFQLAFQIGFDFRPFGVDDAEEDAVADAARGGEHVLAKDALLFRAETQDSVS